MRRKILLLRLHALHLRPTCLSYICPSVRISQDFQIGESPLSACLGENRTRTWGHQERRHSCSYEESRASLSSLPLFSLWPTYDIRKLQPPKNQLTSYRFQSNSILLDAPASAVNVSCLSRPKGRLLFYPRTIPSLSLGEAALKHTFDRHASKKVGTPCFDVLNTRGVSFFKRANATQSAN
jgi:hypothetical protein